MKSKDLKKYETDYTELPFEDILREFRQKNIFSILKSNPHATILEIGSGPLPLFRDFNDYEKMVVVEPGSTFFEIASNLANRDTRIRLINDFFEIIVQDLVPETFDIIIIGGFLHEISNPDEVLQAVKKVAGKNTIIHSFVPNANSFHRLVAFEMGLIKDVYQKSTHDELFQRVEVYNMGSFKKLFTQNNFSVTGSGTYFIKPFTNCQMQAMLTSNIINNTVLDGLNAMIKYLPDYGAEMYVNGTVN
jgi:SAM-dependent methyltransferase